MTFDPTAAVDQETVPQIVSDPTASLDEVLIAAANAGALLTNESRLTAAAVPTADDLVEAAYLEDELASVDAEAAARLDADPADRLAEAASLSDIASEAAGISDIASDEAARAVQTRIWTTLVVGVPGDRTLLIVDWLMLACRAHGMIARAIPLGNARGGLHGMFIEMAAPGDGDAEQALAGLPGGPVDLLVCGEHLELARAIEAGWCDPEVTTIVASSRRVMTDLECTVQPGHVLREADIDAVAKAQSRAYIAFDAPRVASWYSLPAGAQPSMLLGAVCSTGALPLEQPALTAAIVQLGVDPRTHLQGFTRGEPRGRRTGGKVVRTLTAEQFVRKRRGVLPRAARPDFEQLIFAANEHFPTAAQAAIRAGLLTISEHSGGEAARTFLELLGTVDSAVRRSTAERLATGSEDEIVTAAARHLTNIIAYPDAAHAATVKLRRQRLQQVRSRHGISRHEAYRVIDLIASEDIDRAQLMHPRLAAHRNAAAHLTNPTHIERIDATSLRGALRLRRLRASKRHRVTSERHQLEYRCAQEYAVAICETAAVDLQLAELVARSGSIIHGAGAARVATRQSAMAFWGRVVRQSLAIDRTSGAAGVPTVSRIIIPFVFDQMQRSGPLALWEHAGKVVGIGMHLSRGGTYADALAFAYALRGLRPPA